MSDQEKLVEARDVMVEAFGRTYAMYGLPDVIGRIYGVLFFAEQPLGLADIANELKVSKATVSVNVRVLEALKSVRKVWQKGSRRDYYEVESNLSNILVESLEMNMKKEMEINSVAISRSKELLTEIEISSDEMMREKVTTYYQNLENLEKQYQWGYQIMTEILEAFKKS